jgi:hypothetical protein
VGITTGCYMLYDDDVHMSHDLKDSPVVVMNIVGTDLKSESCY